MRLRLELIIIGFFFCEPTESRFTNYGEVSSHMTGNIIGGVKIPIDMFPFVATLSQNGKVHCGGSIISRRTVITAAHCILIGGTTERLPPHVLTVYLGGTKFRNGRPYEVCNTIAHERFRRPSNMYIQYGYDIGLVFLKNNIIFGPTVQMTRIPTDYKFQNSRYSFTVAGFGYTEEDMGVSSVLKMARLRYHDSDSCNRSQSDPLGSMKHVILPPSMFCAMGSDWSGDCYGDSGSGIIWRKKIVGLVSFGRSLGCGSDMLPSMYVNTVYFRNWIYSKMRKFENKPCAESPPPPSGRTKKTMLKLSLHKHAGHVPDEPNEPKERHEPPVCALG